MVRYTNQRTCRVQTYAELLMQLPVKGLKHGFPGFYLATGKLPAPTLVSALGAPGDENPAPGINHNTNGHMEWFDSDGVRFCIRR